MADTIEINEVAQFEVSFVDGDTRTFSIPNPKDNIGYNEIAPINDYIRANNLLVGDKTGATFAQINSVYRYETKKLTLDLSE